MYLSKKGKFKSSVYNDTVEPLIAVVDIKNFDPQNADAMHSGLSQFSQFLLSLKVTRTFNYQPLKAVHSDVEKSIGVFFGESQNGINISEIKNWFVNRYLYSAHSGSLSEVQLYNLEYAKKCFSIVDSDFSFSRVMASSNEIMINTPNGEIYYEYLSSGFKSVISIIFGIIKDIELRFKEPFLKVDEFDGIIVIDELELHLHPSWQSKIAKILREVFPEAQFIATTHSPHIIQSADPDEIIALVRDNGEVKQKELPNSEFGFQGWTIEEILTDVMGLGDTRTESFNEILSKYDSAISKQDYKMAKEHYDVLDKLLHPNNHLRKLLNFDLISLKSNHDD